jgi:hypothetical protein
LGENKVEFLRLSEFYNLKEIPILSQHKRNTGTKSEARINLYENAEKYYGRISKISKILRITAESLNNVHKYKIYYETKYRKENKETENNMSC